MDENQDETVELDEQISSDISNIGLIMSQYGAVQSDVDAIVGIVNQWYEMLVSMIDYNQAYDEFMVSQIGEDKFVAITSMFEALCINHEMIQQFGNLSDEAHAGVASMYPSSFFRKGDNST